MSDEQLDTERTGSSPLYMVIWFALTFIILACMVIQFTGIQNLIEVAQEKDTTVANVDIDNITRNIPYEPLIYTLIVYMLGLFGVEGTRSIVKSLDVSGLKKGMEKEGKCIPKYKHNRLLAMLITFFALSLIAIVFQLLCKQAQSNYHLETIFYGILAGCSLIAYVDVSPKLSADLATNAKNKVELEKELAELKAEE